MGLLLLHMMSKSTRNDFVQKIFAYGQLFSILGLTLTLKELLVFAGAARISGLFSVSVCVMCKIILPSSAQLNPTSTQLVGLS